VIRPENMEPARPANPEPTRITASQAASPEPTRITASQAPSPEPTRINAPPVPPRPAPRQVDPFEQVKHLPPIHGDFPEREGTRVLAPGQEAATRKIVTIGAIFMLALIGAAAVAVFNNVSEPEKKVARAVDAGPPIVTNDEPPPPYQRSASEIAAERASAAYSGNRGHSPKGAGGEE
jgi:hypothetical protein